MNDVADLIGVPYKDGGRDMNGMDCYGLLLEVFRRHGMFLPDIRYEDHSLELSNRYAPTLPLRKFSGPPKELTVLEMNCGGELHVGVCVSRREFIHATRLGVRISPVGLYPVRGMYEWVSYTCMKESEGTAEPFPETDC